MADRLGASTFFERIDDNPFIELYYHDPERHALSVQLSFLFSRLKQWQELHQQDKLNFADKPEDIDALLQRIIGMRSGTEFWADHSG